jgi:hypothetical protein
LFVEKVILKMSISLLSSLRGQGWQGMMLSLALDFYREHRGLEVCKLLLLLLLLLGGHFANLSNRYASSPCKGLPTLIHVITVTSSDSTNTCASGTECFSILLMLVFSKTVNIDEV